MRTARLLPLSPSMHCSRGGVPGPRGDLPGQGGVSGPGGVPGRGVYLVQGSVPARSVPGQGGVPGQGVYLLGVGVYLPGGVPGPGGCTCPGGMYLVPGGTWSGGCTCPGVYLPRGAPAHALPPCEQNNKQV